jgi:cytochrome b561
MSLTFKYSSPAILIHWLVAFLIVTAIVMGVYMTSLAISPLRLKLYNWHKWLGISILMLSVIRLTIRMLSQSPPAIEMVAWQRFAAQFVHLSLYSLFFVVPLVGWAYSSASGFPVVLFGVISLPDFVAADEVLAVSLRAWHDNLAILLGLLALVHIVAALKHQFIDRDGLLSRMRPKFLRGN